MANPDLSSARLPDGLLPDGKVRAAFGGVEGEVEVLQGGAETSIRVGPTVFKRVDDVVVAAWSQAALAAIGPIGWRVPRPVAATNGRWVVNGWTATAFIDGLRPFIEQPDTAIGIGLELAELLADHVATAALAVGQRTDRWAVADRVAWGEQDLATCGVQPDVADLVGRLRSHCEERTEQTTVVHGDLASNLFLDASATPTVLDLSPYVRPARYGSAIVVVDHVLWFDGSAGRRAPVDHDSLARALLFRVLAHQLSLAPGDDHGLAEIIPIVERFGL